MPPGFHEQLAANDVLDLIGQRVREAMEAKKGYIQDLKRELAQLDDAWVLWDLDVLAAMGVITARQAKDGVKALAILES